MAKPDASVDMASVDTVIFDVDGTLVDTAYHHVLAWTRSFLRFGIVVPAWRVHRTIGMGGDRLVATLAGDEVESTFGDALRGAWVGEFDRLIDEIRPLDGAHDLLAEVKRRGFKVVLASSGEQSHVERFLDLVGAASIADAVTTSADVDASKPEPDIVRAAMERVSAAGAVMVGDATWDVIAARRSQVPTIGVLTGGYSREELLDAGATDVFDSLRDLAAGLDDGPLARPRS